MKTELVKTNCGPVEFSESGAGDPVLYFHGTGLDGGSMLAFEIPLVESGFRLIIPNRPGYGNTPLSSGRSASDCADLAASLLDALGIGATHVMGSSGGAAFATAFAKTYSKRTRSLVLLCPQLHRWNDKRWLPVGGRWTLPFLRNRLLRKLLLKLYAVQVPKMTADQFLKKEAGIRYASVADDAAALQFCRDALAGMVDGVRNPGFENDFIIFVNEDIIDNKEQITVPTLVLHDEHDPITPVDHVQWFSSLVPACELVSLHTAGHLVWVGPDSQTMHDTRVRFLMRHEKGAAQHTLPSA